RPLKLRLSSRPMRAKKTATLALVVVMLGIERLAYYATRATLFLWMMREQHLPAQDAAVTAAWLSTLTLVFPVPGGFPAIGVGPRIVALVGAILATAGEFVLPAGASVGWFVALAGVGIGLLKPCAWAIAADELARQPAAPGVDPATVPPNPRRFALVAGM